MTLDTYFGWLAFLELRNEDVRKEERKARRFQQLKKKGVGF